jgi:hypothetical protein
VTTNTVYIQTPDEPILKRVIDKLAKAAIVGDGYALEKELVEANQQEFEFLKHVLVVAPVE